MLRNRNVYTGVYWLRRKRLRPARTQAGGGWIALEAWFLIFERRRSRNESAAGSPVPVIRTVALADMIGESKTWQDEDVLASQRIIGRQELIEAHQKNSRNRRFLRIN